MLWGNNGLEFGDISYNYRVIISQWEGVDIYGHAVVYST